MIEFLRNSLTTENGFLNEACINELNSLVKNMPKTHERLQNDPEWAEKRITHYREITGHFAEWAIRQLGCISDCEFAFPPHLEKIVGFLHACLRKHFDKLGYAELSLCDISKLLYDILYEQNISHFDDWNKKEILGDSWLDLDALLHNVCLSIRDNRRAWKEFNEYFEKKD